LTILPGLRGIGPVQLAVILCLTITEVVDEVGPRLWLEGFDQHIPDQ
jgi:hypothetical protein